MKKLLGKHSRLWSLLSEKMNKSYSESLAFINIYLWHNIFFHKRETVSPNIFNRQVNMKITQSCPTLCDTVHGILQARILEWVAFLFLLQGILPTQGSNPGLPHCRRILYQLSHQGSPLIGKCSLNVRCISLPFFLPPLERNSHQLEYQAGQFCVYI